MPLCPAIPSPDYSTDMSHLVFLLQMATVHQHWSGVGGWRTPDLMAVREGSKNIEDKTKMKIHPNPEGFRDKTSCLPTFSFRRSIAST